MEIGKEYKCKSKYSENHEYFCVKEDSNRIRIYKDKFKVIVTPIMFNSLFEIYQ